MSVFILIVIATYLWIDKYMSKREKFLFTGCIFVTLCLNLCNFLLDFLARPEYAHLVGYRRLWSFFSYSLRPLLLMGFWELLRSERSRWMHILMGSVVIVNSLIFSTCFFSDLTFGYNPENYHWYRGPLGFTAHYAMAFMMVMFIPALINMYFNGKKRDFRISFLFLVLILGSTIYDTFFNHESLIDIINAECILYFLFFHIEIEQEYTKALVVAQKAEMMMMQIKPHFVNNTLSTIQALCEIDPKLAARTTGNFAKYLRTNLASMDKMLPITIEEEIAHTRTYLEIETLRFPWVETEYDIQDVDFSIPPLTIQPLAENAVQHGLRKKKKGKLMISTRLTEKGHMIEVRDNGIGFDTMNPATKEGHGLGVKNVKFRIENMCHGTLNVDSVEGEGTVIRIYIPDKNP